MTARNGRPATPAPLAAKSQQARRRPRHRGTGGVFPLRDGVWRVDVEIARDSVTGRRRRVSRTVVGSREEAEIALARLKVAGHDKRLPSGGTNARSVHAAFQLYLQAVDAGLVELAPRTIVTTRSAARTMCSVLLPDGRAFGDVRLSRLTWQDIEGLYAGMRASGRSTAWVRRCATVLNRTLDLARKRGLLDANPATDATRPRSSRTKPFSPTGTVADILGNSESTLRLHYDGRTDVGQEESHCGARARIIRAGMTPPPVCLDLSLSPETEALGRVKSG